MYRIIIIVSLLLLSILLVPNKAQSDVETQVATTTPKVHIANEEVKTFDSEIERLAKKYRQNPTLARKIIKCEGELYKTKGNNKNYRNGRVWSTDLGWWQINDYYHLKSAKKLGLNLHNEWDNLEYGFWLLKKEGTWPWKASKHCWNK